MAYFNPLFIQAPSTGPITYDPIQPIWTSLPDPSGGILQTIFGGGMFGGPVSVPISGFSPVQNPTLPVPTGGVGMPAPITGKCALRMHRRMNWCNPRALSRANRRLHAFNKHARRYIKITRKVKVGRRRRK